MSSRPRVILSKSYYHIIARGNNHQTLFYDTEDFQYYLELIKRFKAELPFLLFHYCLMPNHIHLLVQVDKAKSFIAFMKKLQLAYFQHYKNRYQWDGHLWQGRYKSQAVGKDAYFIQCGKYIELNAFRAKIVSRPEDYAFSSYRYYALGQANQLISEDFFYSELGKDAQSRRMKYRELVVSDDVLKGYDKEIWAKAQEKYNERKKHQQALKRKRANTTS